MNWEKADTGFIESDVITWTEAIWPPSTARRRRAHGRRKPRPIGKQRVTAQITQIDADYLALTVLKAEIIENTTASEIKPYKTGSAIRKKLPTLLRGEPQRLLWSEEDVRNALLYPNKLHM